MPEHFSFNNKFFKDLEKFEEQEKLMKQFEKEIKKVWDEYSFNNLFEIKFVAGKAMKIIIKDYPEYGVWVFVESDFCFSVKPERLKLNAFIAINNHNIFRYVHNLCLTICVAAKETMDNTTNDEIC